MKSRAIVLGLIGGIGLWSLLDNRAWAKAVTNASNQSRLAVWDKVSEDRLDKLHPIVAAKASQFLYMAEKNGIRLRVVSGYRSYQDQADLYAQGRTETGNIVTNAKPGYSYHNFGLAIDVVEIKNGQALWENPSWPLIAKIGKEMGFEWGGDWSSFKDKPHFQMSLGKTLAEWRAAYESGKSV